MPVPPQSQEPPGIESKMEPLPIFDMVYDEFEQKWVPYKPANKLAGKVALITGGDSGIGT